MEQDRGVAPEERGKTGLWRQVSREKPRICCMKLVFQEACMALAVLLVARKTGGFLLLRFPDLSSVLAQARRGPPLLQNSDAPHTPPRAQPPWASVGLALVSPTTLFNMNQEERGPESAIALTSWPSLGPSSFNPSVFTWTLEGHCKLPAVKLSPPLPSTPKATTPSLLVLSSRASGHHAVPQKLLNQP